MIKAINFLQNIFFCGKNICLHFNSERLIALDYMFWFPIMSPSLAHNLVTTQ